MIGVLLLILNLCMLAVNYASGWTFGVMLSGIGVILSAWIISNDD